MYDIQKKKEKETLSCEGAVGVWDDGPCFSLAAIAPIDFFNVPEELELRSTWVHSPREIYPTPRKTIYLSNGE
jgi:hypothetical protein